MRAQGKETDPKTGKHTLCEPARSKRTWTFHKDHFAWKFIGKMADPTPTILIEHRALTLTLRTQCGHTVWGIIFFIGKRCGPQCGACKFDAEGNVSK